MEREFIECARTFNSIRMRQRQLTLALDHYFIRLCVRVQQFATHLECRGHLIIAPEQIYGPAILHKMN